MIVGFLGTMGKGKTLSMTWMALLFKQETGIDYVVSNYETDFADEIVRSPRELEQRSEYLKEQGIVAIYLLDEVWAWMDSRESMENTTMTEFVLNSRKRLGMVMWTSQDDSQPDKRLTNNTDYKVLCRHYDVHETNTEYAVQKIVVFKRTEGGEYIKMREMTFNAEEIYGIYDTQEEVSSKSKSEEYEKLIEEYAELVASGAIIQKNELFSTLTMEEKMSKSDAREITHYIFNKLVREGKIKEKGNGYEVTS